LILVNHGFGFLTLLIIFLQKTETAPSADKGKKAAGQFKEEFQDPTIIMQTPVCIQYEVVSSDGTMSAELLIHVTPIPPSHPVNNLHTSLPFLAF